MAPARSLFPVPTGQPMEKTIYKASWTTKTSSAAHGSHRSSASHILLFVYTRATYQPCAHDPPPAGLDYGRPPAAHRGHGRRGARTAPVMRAGPPLPHTGGSCVGRPPSTRPSPPIHPPSEGRGRTRGWPGSSPLPHPRTTEKECCRKPLAVAGPPTLGRGEREGPGGSARGDSRSRVCLQPLSRPLRCRRMNGRVSTPFHPPPSKRLLGPTFDPCTPGDGLLSPTRCRHTESTLLSVCGHTRDSLMAAHRHHPIRQSRPPSSVLVAENALGVRERDAGVRHPSGPRTRAHVQL